jgi:hypothetical protein
MKGIASQIIIQASNMELKNSDKIKEVQSFSFQDNMRVEKTSFIETARCQVIKLAEQKQVMSSNPKQVFKMTLEDNIYCQRSSEQAADYIKGIVCWTLILVTPLREEWLHRERNIVFMGLHIKYVLKCFIIL